MLLDIPPITRLLVSASEIPVHLKAITDRTGNSVIDIIKVEIHPKISTRNTTSGFLMKIPYGTDGSLTVAERSLGRPGTSLVNIDQDGNPYLPVDTSKPDRKETTTAGKALEEAGRIMQILQEEDQIVQDFLDSLMNPENKILEYGVKDYDPYSVSQLQMMLYHLCNMKVLYGPHNIDVLNAIYAGFPDQVRENLIKTLVPDNAQIDDVNKYIADIDAVIKRKQAEV